MRSALRDLEPAQRVLAEQAIGVWLASGIDDADTTRSAPALLGLGVGLAGAGAIPPLTNSAAVAIGAAVAGGSPHASRWSASPLAGVLASAAGFPSVIVLEDHLDDAEFAVARELARLGTSAVVVSSRRSRTSPYQLAGWRRCELEYEDLSGGLALGVAMARDLVPTVLVVHDPTTHASVRDLLGRLGRRHVESAAPLHVVAYRPETPRPLLRPELRTHTPRQVARSLLGAAPRVVRLAPTRLRDTEVELVLGAPVVHVPDPERLATALLGTGITAVVIDFLHDDLVVSAARAEVERRPLRVEDAVLALGRLLEGAPERVVVPSIGRLPGEGALDLHVTVVTEGSGTLVLSWAEAAGLATQLISMLSGTKRPLTLVEIVQTDPLPERLSALCENAQRIVVVGPPRSPVAGRLATWLLEHDAGMRTTWYRPDASLAAAAFGVDALSGS